MLAALESGNHNRWLWCYTCQARVQVDDHPKCHGSEQFVLKRGL